MNYQYKLTHFKGDLGHGVASDVVKEALVTCSLPILVKKMDVGALVKKTLSCASGLLAGICGVLVRPDIINGHLPIPVCAVRASACLMRRGPQ